MLSSSRLLVTGALIALAASAIHAQDSATRTVLFREADQAMAAAREAQAELLAPRSFALGERYYRAADGRFERGGNLDRVRSDLARATQEFQTALESTTLARVTFGNAIKSRTDAQKAEAPKRESDTWAKAEREFELAAKELEMGNLGNARDRGSRAEELYRNAELAAIKQVYLGEIRRLLKQAREERVKRYAPETLAKAETLAERAEKELEENRYDADLPRSLAREAAYEARHSLYLADYIRKLREDDRSHESIVLEWEQPLRQVAAAADLVAEFDEGHEKPTREITSYVESVREENRDLQEEMKVRDQRIFGLEEEMTELDQRLGGARDERVRLAQELAMQERIREQIRQVDALFTREEALVFREGNDILIRLVGLNFTVGRADIENRALPLLTKVEEAIRVFPRSELIVEGHTDSHGSDDTNLKLSQDRAETIRQYLVSNMRLDPRQVRALGYGETAPVANNETPEGRAKNRRIDIRIRPEKAIT